MILGSLEYENKKLLLELGGNLAGALSYRIHAVRNPEIKLADILEENIIDLPVHVFLSSSDFDLAEWKDYDTSFQYSTIIDWSLIREELGRVANTPEGKKAIIEYVMARDLELQSVSDEDVIAMAIFGSDLYFKVYVRLIKAAIRDWLENLTTRNVSEEKNILFLLLIFKNYFRNQNIIDVYGYCIERFQKKSGLDYEYIEEFENIAKKFLQVRCDAIDLITE